MLDGMKWAEQGMIQMEQKQAIMSNNLANGSTYGYRKEAYNQVSFDEVMRQQAGLLPDDDENKQVYMKDGGSMETSQMLVGFTSTSYNVGEPRQTGNNFDLMLDDNGVGFFTVKTPEGTRYTRNGNFKLSTDGNLVTSDGCKVQGLNGDIHVNGTNFEVTGDGYVKVDGKTIDRLKITTFLDRRVLANEGGTYLKAPSDKGIVLNQGIRVKQGFIEGSNVNPVQEMVEMLNVSRNFEANQKVLQAEDHVLQKAANELGKVR